ncbi:MAG: hypothetical protein ACREE7_18450, partial [Dongiaceae bacterium]
MQERVGTPSIWTVQAPHCAMPQPNLGPVRKQTNRDFAVGRCGILKTVRIPYLVAMIDVEAIRQRFS